MTSPSDAATARGPAHDQELWAKDAEGRRGARTDDTRNPYIFDHAKPGWVEIQAYDRRVRHWGGFRYTSVILSPNGKPMQYSQHRTLTGARSAAHVKAVRFGLRIVDRTD